MSLLSKVIGDVAIRRMPWVVRVYILLVLVFTGLLFASAFVPFPMPDGITREVIEALPRSKAFSVTADLLKTVLGALLGSLSLAAEKHLGSAPDEEEG